VGKTSIIFYPVTDSFTGIYRVSDTKDLHILHQSLRYLRLFLHPSAYQKHKRKSGGIVLAAICWAASAQRRVLPDRELYLQTASHLLIVNNLLSHFSSLSRSLFIVVALSSAPAALVCLLRK
jgi:hypothetical protein